MTQLQASILSTVPHRSAAGRPGAALKELRSMSGTMWIQNAVEIRGNYLALAEQSRRLMIFLGYFF
jgi:hypothetical protein